MKRFFLIFFFSFLAKFALADHITGGEMYYTYIGMNGGNHVYEVTLKLFRHCGNVGAQLDESAAIGVFDNTTNALISNHLVQRGSRETLRLTTPGPCVSNAPDVCYEVGYYTRRFELAPSTRGYTIAYQRCCRIMGINNLSASNNTGATYTAFIPGTDIFPDAPINNSAVFTARDTVIVCGGYPFTYSFSATDPDGTDELRYEFADGWLGGSGGNSGNAAPNPPANPPYFSVSYAAGYSGSSPLGFGVTIDPLTGIISGTSPPEGIYVVTVAVSEIRNGRVIAVQRKDVQIKAGGCDLTKPILDNNMITCDGYSYTFTQSVNPKINTYHWEFGDPGSGPDNFSTERSPTHIYSVAGEFTVKVVANRGQECSDSSTGVVKVYPGFFPSFTTTGVCINNPVMMNDASTTNHGVINSWAWNMGDETTQADVSTSRDTSWLYNTTGTKTVQLTVGSSVGCQKTISQQITVINRPPITLAFKDTLICVPDNVQLQASGTGIFNWSPVTNMLNAGTGTPTVNPTTTTKYYVTLNEQGCVNTDSVIVNVVNHVTLAPMNDTVICLTDQAQLWVASNGLRYEWTPDNTLDDPILKNPVATPLGTTTYQVRASIGSCNATESVTVSTVPYPVANAGADTLICYNTPAYLNGSHNGSSFSWSPTNTLLNSNTLSPTAYPARTQSYVLQVNDTRGCPKPGYDTVLVSVLPKIQPYAGNDTLVIVGQPLQLNGNGGISYLWTPSNGLSDPTLPNPIGTYTGEFDSIRYTLYVFNEAGCFDTASVKVTIFKTDPTIFVPSAFTPNNDGLNDIIRPIAVGIKQIKYFRIFNRWGQMVFQTTTNGHGWDGRINGREQGNNVYAWTAEAIDYLNKPIQLKGTITLIR